ncbi:MAG: signal peptidase I [Bacteroidetes bacterium]|uniref:signal peptidase I n=1 Tax=Flavobacterium filum TaxID=370974 RepID=UPI0023F39867|nr:signal peptidase I [Flavobacterium filum]MCA0429370.1 signal peptidase I [Bacteroidota bacterium]
MGNIIFLVLIVLSFIGLSKLFIKTNIAAWKAFVPIYNFYELSKLLNKPWWWCLIMIVPGVNILMYGVYGFNVSRAFNKPANNDLILASILPYIAFLKLGFDDSAKFVGLSKFELEPSKFVKNWLDPIIFAIIAASIFRGFFIEAFTIPTSSLEKSLMVGDFLFVNKFAYGAKIPQTPMSFPLAHHTLPLTTSTKSYLEWIKLPYYRLPGFGTVKNNDIVVFNYPDGDSVLLNMQDMSYYNYKRYVEKFKKEDDVKYNIKQPASYYKTFAIEHVSNPNNPNMFTGNPVGKVVARPVDKRDNYVKRCVGIAGDKFEIKDGEIFISDTKQEMPKNAQHNYLVKCSFRVFGDYIKLPNGRPSLSNLALLDKYDIYATEVMVAAESKDSIIYRLNMPRHVAEEIKKIPNVISVTREIEPKGKYEFSIFPHSPTYPWNNDNYGPLLIPKKGQTVKIDTSNICIYQKIMDTYDDGIHKVTVNGSQVMLDGNPITSYTFKQDYYFMMGDNRHNSADSRSWGFVPFDHVVGSPFFVWLSVKYEDNNPISGASFIKSLFKNSKEGKYRWDRFLCYVDDGNLHSVKIPFLIVVALIWGASKLYKKRKLKQSKT